MPSLLITTSRRTSNRVRTFVRDLQSVIPDSIRFNRGGMSLAELASRIGQSGTSGAMVISTYKGNPGTIQVLDSQGVAQYELIVESALLRRETHTKSRIRIKELSAIFVSEGVGENTIALVEYLASLINTQVMIGSDESVLRTPESEIAMMHFYEADRKIHWTTFHTHDLTEIGPRIRIAQIRKVPHDI